MFEFLFVQDINDYIIIITIYGMYKNGEFYECWNVISQQHIFQYRCVENSIYSKLT